MPAARGSSDLLEALSLAGKKVLSRLSREDSTVNIFLLSAEDMIQLEKRVGMDRPGHTPNVLSFAEPVDFPHPEARENILGDVYLNKELIAKGFGELVYLLIHGILHLLGYSHERKNDILNMESLEDELCENVLSDKQLVEFLTCHPTLLPD